MYSRGTQPSVGPATLAEAPSRSPLTPGAPDSASARRAPVRALELLEMILKQPDELDRMARDTSRQAELVVRCLGVALGGLTIFALTLVLVFQSAGLWPALASSTEIRVAPTSRKR